MPMLLPEESLTVRSIRPRAVCAGDLELAWPSARPDPLGPPSVAIERQRRTRRGRAARPPSKLNRARSTRWHAVGAVPMLSAIRLVSFSIDRHFVCITFAKRYKGGLLIAEADPHKIM